MVSPLDYSLASILIISLTIAPIFIESFNLQIISGAGSNFGMVSPPLIHRDPGRKTDDYDKKDYEQAKTEKAVLEWSNP
jgi:hypothetical protein